MFLFLTRFMISAFSFTCRRFTGNIPKSFCRPYAKRIKRMYTGAENSCKNRMRSSPVISRTQSPAEMQNGFLKGKPLIDVLKFVIFKRKYRDMLFDNIPCDDPGFRFCSRYEPFFKGFLRLFLSLRIGLSSVPGISASSFSVSPSIPLAPGRCLRAVLVLVIPNAPLLILDPVMCCGIKVQIRQAVKANIIRHREPSFLPEDASAIRILSKFHPSRSPRNCCSADRNFCGLSDIHTS